MDKAVPRPWAPRRCSHGPPGSTDARRAEGTCGGPGQRTSETVRKGSSHKKSERANLIHDSLITTPLISLFLLLLFQGSLSFPNMPLQPVKWIVPGIYGTRPPPFPSPAYD